MLKYISKWFFKNKETNKPKQEEYYYDFYVVDETIMISKHIKDKQECSEVDCVVLKETLIKAPEVQKAISQIYKTIYA